MFRRNSTIADKCSQHFIGTELSTLGRFWCRGRKLTTRGENCVQLIDDILRQKFGATENAIENAHRVGKQYGDKPRHVIVRFFSRVTRLDVFRSARDKLAGTGIRIVDDRHEKKTARSTVYECAVTNNTVAD